MNVLSQMKRRQNTTRFLGHSLDYEHGSSMLLRNVGMLHQATWRDVVKSNADYVEVLEIKWKFI
jgi:hypothetical protein